MSYRDEYEAEYRPMRAAATKVTGDLLKRLVAKCQENPWLKVGGIDFEDDPCMESDYAYALERYEDPAMLQKFFLHGNWSIRTAVQYRDLIFVNQVNGGDEWWTLKIADDKLIAFESISCRRMIQHLKFAEYLDRMIRATPEQCKSLDY